MQRGNQSCLRELGQFRQMVDAPFRGNFETPAQWNEPGVDQESGSVIDASSSHSVSPPHSSGCDVAHCCVVVVVCAARRPILNLVFNFDPSFKLSTHS